MFPYRNPAGHGASVKTRILIIVVILGMLCPSALNAADLSTTPAMARLAALTIGAQSEKQMTPRPGVRVADCTPENVRCTSSGECCGNGSMFCVIVLAVRRVFVASANVARLRLGIGNSHCISAG